MPKVVAQPPRGVPKARNGSLLSRAVPVIDVADEGLHCSVYGRLRTGKTRFASTFPKPILFLSPEPGTRSIKTIPGIDVISVIIRGAAKPRNDHYIYLDELGALVAELSESHYKTVVEDTASKMHELNLATVLGLEEIPVQKSWGFATRAQYGQAGIQTKTQLRSLLELPQHVVILSHEKSLEEDETPSDVMFPTIGSSLPESPARFLNGELDYVFQTYIREKTKTTEQNVNGTKIQMQQKVGGVDYCLRIGPDPVFMTGIRAVPGAKIPDYISDPSYESVMKIINGKG